MKIGQFLAGLTHVIGKTGWRNSTVLTRILLCVTENPIQYIIGGSLCALQVMLLSLQAGGVGLNLIGGNHIFMLDMHWNPALEVQAADRCHRVGQKRDVFIHKFVCESTVEERILQLQHQKLMLAKNVLDG